MAARDSSVAAAPPAPAHPPAARLAVSGGMFAALRVPGYARLWTSGWLWNLTRWMSVFLCSYVVNQRTGSPLLVQLVGAAFFAPMFFGGILGGVISDRFDRRGTIMRQLLLLSPIALLMSTLVFTDKLHVWMVYPFVLAIGIGGVLDMTSRRALIFDLVGPERITNAMAIESMAQTGGTMLGALVGGAVINFIGIGYAFLLIGVVYLFAWVVIAGMAPVPREHAPAAGGSLRGDIAAGLRYVRRSRMIIGILGVTVLMNGCYFTYMPMVPVFADRLGVNAFWAGVLGSATGLGSLAGALVLAANAGRWPRAWTYITGSGIAMASLIVFALSPWYGLALAALLAAGIGQSGFGSLQGALILLSSTAEMRGRAMGILSMAIGVLPFAMVLLGLAAQGTNPAIAVTGSVLVGLVGLVLWVARSPEMRAVR